MKSRSARHLLLFLPAAAFFVSPFPLRAQGYGFLIGEHTLTGPVVDEWTVRHSYAGGGDDRLSEAAFDGSLYLAGTSYRQGSSYDFAIVKQSADGEREWIRYAGGSLADAARDLSLHPCGDVVVTGEIFSLTSGNDLLTVCYGPDGKPVWAGRYDAIGEWDGARSLAVDRDGNVFVTGRSQGGGEVYESDDIATLKYDAGGTLEWIRRYGGPGNAHDSANSVVAGDDGRVYVAGSTYDADESMNIVTIAFDRYGAVLWTAIYNNLADGQDWGQRVLLDGRGIVFVAGDSDFGDQDFLSIKYRETGLTADPR